MRVKRMVSKSRLEPRNVPKISPSSVKMHRAFVGRGACSQVHQVTLQHKKEKRYYALKALDTTRSTSNGFAFVSSPDTDLRLEADILSRLNHPNIIHLHGVSSSSSSTRDDGEEQEMDGFGTMGMFLILDFLDDTLSQRLMRWRLDKEFGRPTITSQQIRSEEVRYRIQRVALGIANGMNYLHSQKVVLRDLKPDNVGFDYHGTVKLFDFGFARELHACDNSEIAGSFRYMAPEHLRAIDENCPVLNVELSSDVYSFGLLLWELCTLEKPYHQIDSQEELVEAVVHQQWRPPVRSIPSALIRTLIAQCWHDLPSHRPNFDIICDMLEQKLIPRSQRRKHRQKYAKSAETSLGQAATRRWGRFKTSSPQYLRERSGDSTLSGHSEGSEGDSFQDNNSV